MWNKLEENNTGRLTTYVITTILFALWHVGYIDTVAYRTGLHGLTGISNILFITMMKVITGLCFGIILGLARYKSRNSLSAILLHSLMNIFGK